MNYIRGLNGLRAIAVICVVWHHTHAPIRGVPITGNGFLGVDVFFVLSGFLITTLLLEERDRTGSISLAGFYVRRTLRIFPLFYAVLGILAAYFLVAKGASQRQAYFDELPTTLLYLSNWFPSTTLMAITWSLATEEQFYLVWPPLLLLLGKRALWLLVAFLIPGQIVNFGLADGWLRSIGLPYESLPILQITFTPIILGSLLAYILRSRFRPSIVSMLSGRRVGYVIFLLAAVANVGGDIRGLPRLTFHLLCTLLLAGIVLNPGSQITKILEWRPLAYVGTISYGVYLLHKIVQDVAVRLLNSVQLDLSTWIFPLCMLGSVAVAGTSFRYFEVPILRLKSTFTKFIPSTPAT